jgi:type III pantothenate kinase
MVAFDGDTPIEEVRTSGDTLAGLSAFACKYAFEKGIVGAVRELTPLATTELETLHIPILRFSADTPVPVTNKYRTPKTLGVDRLAAAVGASTLKPNKDLLIIDAGTCITYEVIDAQGNYWGGNIAPGMHMRLNALHSFTAKLPLIEAEGPVPGMGYDTETAIRSGALQGAAYELEGYITACEAENPGLLVFLTGGDAERLAAIIKRTIFVDRNLVAKGLNRILEYNVKL